MKAVSISLPLLVSWVSGCGDDAPPTPDASGPGITITIQSDKAPALVAFRDGVDAAWQPATMKAPNSFEAEVHGPYVVTVVCEVPATGESLTFQLARTPDDARELMQPCDFPAVTRYPVTGQMVQAGRVQIDDQVRSSATAGWTFTLQVRGGIYDLMAITTDQIALRPGLPVTSPTALSPPIDVVQEGTLLADVAFTVTNAAPSETVVASVQLDKPSPATPLSVYRGPIGTAKVVPDSLATAADSQSASMQATVGSSLRALRRPFRVGGDTVYTLPDALAGVQWEVATGALAVSWSSVPPFTAFSLSASGSSGTRSQRHDLDLSPRFFEATGATRASLDSNIPGYKPEWRVDFSRSYSRQLFVQRVAEGVIATSWASEQITGAAQLASTTPLLPPGRADLAAP
jgi:hypothetical protein